ncbi:MAG: hypothetical protein ABW223_01970 [Rariglobus sp.]
MIAKALRRFHATFLSGWWRWPKEHYHVFAGPQDGPFQHVRSPFGSYFADPFVWTHQGEPWLFVEQFLHNQNRGRLVARRLSGGPLLPIDLVDFGHASFPCVFEADGQLFLIPETCNTGTIDLYTCERFPDRWRHVRRLAANIDAADTAPLHHAGRWWFITSVRGSSTDGGHRALAIYHTSDLLHGDWIAHPVNAERRHVESPYSSGRNAGAIITLADGQLIRPIHSSARYYGENLRWTRIDELTPDMFNETLLDNAPAEFAALPRIPMHHVSTHDGWIACDTRSRIPFGLKPPVDSATASAGRTR